MSKSKQVSAPKINLAPALRCSSGPTLGCHEQGKLYRILHEGRHIESRVLCEYHRRMVKSYSGEGYSLEVTK